MRTGHREASEVVNRSLSDESRRRPEGLSPVRRALVSFIATSLVVVPGLAVIFREPGPLWRVYSWGFVAGWFGGAVVLTIVRSVADRVASRGK